MNELSVVSSTLWCYPQRKHLVRGPTACMCVLFGTSVKDESRTQSPGHASYSEQCNETVQARKTLQ